jgi:hypothetical protein
VTKKGFIALADAIIKHNKKFEYPDLFDYGQLQTLADFCKSQNPNFKRERWLDYICGECGPNGGKR